MDSELIGDPLDRTSRRIGISSRFTCHPGGPVLEFLTVLAWCCHALHPSQVREPPTDPGRFSSCYRSHAWAAALEATSTTHKRTRPYTPRTNGKVERFNGTLAREWAYVREYESEEHRRAELPAFLNFYNHDRPHAALGHRPPASRVPWKDYRLTASGIVVPDLPARPQQLSFDDLTA